MKKWIYKLNRYVPFIRLPIAKFKNGKLDVTLYNNYWINVSDGSSNDLLPLTMCSEKLIERCAEELDK